MTDDTLRAEAHDTAELLHDAALAIVEQCGVAEAARRLRWMATKIEGEAPEPTVGPAPKRCDYCGRKDQNCENEAQVIGCPPLPF